MFTEFESRDPFARGAIPFVLGDSRVLILFEPPIRDDGEMDVVSYYLTGEEHRDPDLVAFFERQILRYQNKKTTKKTKPKPTGRKRR